MERLPPLIAATLTFGLLSAIQVLVPRPMLLAERLWPGVGWVEALALSAYAGLLVSRMQDPRRSGLWRRRAWWVFSVVFFGQLVLGFLGLEVFWMTGRLHVPVPAVIVGGPVFRGEGLFMPILFLSTLVLVGPAWCSHLCYFGAWDNLAAEARRRPKAMPRWRPFAQPAMLILVVGAAMTMRWMGVSGTTAAMLAVLFGVGGAAVMALASPRLGYMAHCTLYCPIGWLATRTGRLLSPFRVSIGAGCDDCLACSTACRFGALSPGDIAARRAGPSCTLCGDCVRPCRKGAIGYRFFRVSPGHARTLFLVLVTSLHAVFLGVARV